MTQLIRNCQLLDHSWLLPGAHTTGVCSQHPAKTQTGASHVRVSMWWPIPLVFAHSILPKMQTGGSHVGVYSQHPAKMQGVLVMSE